MDKFINANDVKELLIGLDSLPWEEEVDDIVDELPGADVVEVKYGKWIDFGATEWQCSECYYVVNRWNDTPYCPNCGAKMDGDEGK